LAMAVIRAGVIEYLTEPEYIALLEAAKSIPNTNY